MEIPKPVAIAIIVVVAIVAIGLAWFLTGGSRPASDSVPKDAYPEVKEQYRLPDSELQRGPDIPPPIAGSGRR